MITWRSMRIRRRGICRAGREGGSGGGDRGGVLRAETTEAGARVGEGMDRNLRGGQGVVGEWSRMEGNAMKAMGGGVYGKIV